MELEYWIFPEEEPARNVSREEYDAFIGEKDIYAKGRGPGWIELTDVLLAYGGRTRR